MSVNDLVHLLLNAPAFTLVLMLTRFKMPKFKKLVKKYILMLAILDKAVTTTQYYWAKWTKKPR
ncbi:hypothetical protein [Lacticaseibacillus porcinae]|uniref:hypothetical protein n=1 Tax=Lacticaseibacillus porcinae TaxID=1123687 RepID=UPI000F77494C|nr:hypothetical protein [Lacticaseibacillus porcinae]